MPSANITATFVKTQSGEIVNFIFCSSQAPIKKLQFLLQIQVKTDQIYANFTLIFRPFGRNCLVSRRLFITEKILCFHLASDAGFETSWKTLKLSFMWNQTNSNLVCCKTSPWTLASQQAKKLVVKKCAPTP